MEQIKEVQTSKHVAPKREKKTCVELYGALSKKCGFWRFST